MTYWKMSSGHNSFAIVILVTVEKKTHEKNLCCNFPLQILLELFSPFQVIFVDISTALGQSFIFNSMSRFRTVLSVEGGPLELVLKIERSAENILIIEAMVEWNE